MAINKRFPHVYDAEYVGPQLREVNLFSRSSATTITYVDAGGASVTRSKGFEDTNLTEDGRINETGMILSHVGVRINPGPVMPDQNEGYDELIFLQRGYAELILNDNQVVFTARIRDLVPASTIVASGALVRNGTEVFQNGSVTVSNVGRPYPANGIRIPRGVRFRLALKWDRPLLLTSLMTCRIEGELWGVSDELSDADRAGLIVPQSSAASAMSIAVPGAR